MASSGLQCRHRGWQEVRLAVAYRSAVVLAGQACICNGVFCQQAMTENRKLTCSFYRRANQTQTKTTSKHHAKSQKITPRHDHQPSKVVAPQTGFECTTREETRFSRRVPSAARRA